MTATTFRKKEYCCKSKLGPFLLCAICLHTRTPLAKVETQKQQKCYRTDLQFIIEDVLCQKKDLSKNCSNLQHRLTCGLHLNCIFKENQYPCIIQSLTKHTSLLYLLQLPYCSLFLLCIFYPERALNNNTCFTPSCCAVQP